MTARERAEKWLSPSGMMRVVSHASMAANAVSLAAEFEAVAAEAEARGFERARAQALGLIKGGLWRGDIFRLDEVIRAMKPEEQP